MARSDVASAADADLVARHLVGDEAAFSELFRRHEERVFAVALRMTGNRSDALDAAQDAFVAAFRRASSFKSEASFGTWLYRIAINASLDLLRKRKRWATDEDIAELDPAMPGERRIDDEVGRRIDVSRALAQLPDDYREAVVMHDLGGIPYEEIARLTNTQIGTVKSRISRGRRKLAELMEQAPSGESSKDTV